MTKKRELYTELFTLYRELAKRGVYVKTKTIILPFSVSRKEEVDKYFDMYINGIDWYDLDDKYYNPYTYEKIYKRHTAADFEREVAVAKKMLASVKEMGM